MPKSPRHVFFYTYFLKLLPGKCSQSIVEILFALYLLIQREYHQVSVVLPSSLLFLLLLLFQQCLEYVSSLRQPSANITTVSVFFATNQAEILFLRCERLAFQILTRVLAVIRFSSEILYRYAILAQGDQQVCLHLLHSSGNTFSLLLSVMLQAMLEHLAYHVV